MQPIGNTLVTFPMTGAQIVSVPEEQCQPNTPTGPTHPFLHLGVSQGFSQTQSKTFAGGNCTAVSVTNVALNGVALDPGATYLVTANTFLADGGDNFTTFKEINPSLRLPGGNDLEMLTDGAAITGADFLSPGSQ